VKRIEDMNKEISSYLGMDKTNLKKSFEGEKEEEVPTTVNLLAHMIKQPSVKKISTEEEKKEH
jgi:hypothetical protein